MQLILLIPAIVIAGTLIEIAFATEIVAETASNVSSTSCGPREGVIRVEITGSRDAWSYTWSYNSMRLLELPDKAFVPSAIANPGTTYGGSWPDVHTSIPQDFVGSEWRLDVPASLTNKKLVATVYPSEGDYKLSMARHLVIIDVQQKLILQDIYTEKKITSLAWSASLRYIVVLHSETVSKRWKSMRDFIAIWSGHPIPYQSISLSLYDAVNGKLTCTLPIQDELAYGLGYVTWSAPQAN